jgi:uncharacterized protein (TIGR02145 family)
MKTFLSIVFLLTVLRVTAQTNMDIYFTNGTVTHIPVNTIDSISYSISGGPCPTGLTTIVDYDGNIYDVVTIDNQCWTQQNLQVSHYKNGATIPTGISDLQWSTLTSGAYAIYNSVGANNTVYGKLYNWYAVAYPAGLCPAGWHVSTESDWNKMTHYLDFFADTSCTGCASSASAGGALKEINTAHWSSPNAGATNNSGFTALPGGLRTDQGIYGSLTHYGYWWTSTSYATTVAHYHYLWNDSSELYHYDNSKNNGYSVRCVKD